MPIRQKGRLNRNPLPGPSCPPSSWHTHSALLLAPVSCGCEAVVSVGAEAGRPTFDGHQNGVQIPTWPLISCVTSGRSLKLSKPQHGQHVARRSDWHVACTRQTLTLCSPHLTSSGRFRTSLSMALGSNGFYHLFDTWHMFVAILPQGLAPGLA